MRLIQYPHFDLEILTFISLEEESFLSLSIASVLID